MALKASLLERALWWSLMCWVWVIWTAGCGAMLAMQDHKMNARGPLAAEACQEAAAARVAGPSDSPPARAAYAFCMEDRDRWAVESAGERIPAS